MFSEEANKREGRLLMGKLVLSSFCFTCFEKSEKRKHGILTNLIVAPQKIIIKPKGLCVVIKA